MTNKIISLLNSHSKCPHFCCWKLPGKFYSLNA